jgi:prepilin-type N-terminal cleavage/methylation domain-containing protein
LKGFKGSRVQGAGEMLRNDSKGFTLIEIIIVMVILSIVSAITIKFLVDSLKIYTMTVNQKTLFDEGKLALERICRDIRDAQSIITPNAGFSGSTIRITRTHATALDSAGADVRYRLTGSTLERWISPNAYAIASNVSTFTVSRAASNEITIQLTLSLGSGENVTLQTKVYPKNLADSANYKNFFNNWKEELST